MHFVGVGGVSMNGLMQLCAHYGAKVSGSDASGEAIEALQRMGHNVYQGVNAEIAHSADIVVYTSAIAPNHPERQVAARQMERSELLGEIASCYPTVVAVAGTHGKTTTTGMLATILHRAKAPFCAHIGGYVPLFGGGITIEGEEIFVTEACEYREHFLSLKPTIGLITNVEYDHPDYYRDLTQAKAAFGRFGNRCRTLVCADGEICSYVHKDVCTYAHPFILSDTYHDGTLEVMCKDAYIRTKLSVWGDFNRQNAALAAMGARLLGISVEDIEAGLADYTGVDRRQQLLGYWRGMPIISDYAHHPTEIAALCRAAKQQYGRIAVLFQPHTYTRTMALLPLFATCFACDTLYLLPTYAARESEQSGVDTALFQAIEVPDKYYGQDTLQKEIEKTPHKKYGAILAIGAGSVHDIARTLFGLQ